MSNIPKPSDRLLDRAYVFVMAPGIGFAALFCAAGLHELLAQSERPWPLILALGWLLFAGIPFAVWSLIKHWGLG